MVNAFDLALRKFPIDRRSFDTTGGLTHCSFGYLNGGEGQLEGMPQTFTGVHFLNGSQHIELLKAFICSPYSNVVSDFTIGASSDLSGGGGLDYRPLVSLLANATFPRVRKLTLGVWELTCNAHCGYGKIGDLTAVLEAFPIVENLAPYGNFELSKPKSLLHLKELRVTLDDQMTGENGGPISNSTLSNLLSSYMPSLRECELDLFCDDAAHGYTLPDIFLNGGCIPHLSELSICARLDDSVWKKLYESPLGQRPGIQLSTQYNE